MSIAVGGRRLSSRRCPCNGGARDLRRCRAGCRRRVAAAVRDAAFAARCARSSPSSADACRCCWAARGAPAVVPAAARLDWERPRPNASNRPATQGCRPSAHAHAPQSRCPRSRVDSEHHGRALTRPLSRRRASSASRPTRRRAAGRCRRSLQAALGGVACHLSYAQAPACSASRRRLARSCGSAATRGAGEGPRPGHCLPAAAPRARGAAHLRALCGAAAAVEPGGCRARASSSFSKCARCSPASTT